MTHSHTQGSHADPTFRSRPRATSEVVRRVGVYLRPYKLMVIGTISCAILSLVSGFMFPALTRVIIDKIINQHRYNLLTPAALGLIAAFFFRELFNSLRIRINNALEQNVIYDIRRHVYARLQRLPVHWFDQRASGDLMTRIIEDVNNVERLLIDGVEQGTVATLSIAAALVLMFHTNTTLALISLIPVPFLIGGALWYTLTAHKRYRVQREASSAMNALLMDNLQGIRQIKAFGRQTHEDERFAERADDLREGTLVVMRAWANYGPAMQFFGAFGTAIVLWAAGVQVIHGKMEIGQLIEFMFYAGMFFYEPIGRLHGLNQILQSARAAAARVFDIFDMSEERSDRRGILQKPVRGDVIYENVSFSYIQEERRSADRQDAVQKSSRETGKPATARHVLHNISLHARPGQMFALVGPTGAGKSTLVNLLPAFYETSSGKILIDGQDI
ncbi:MAG TPA: ABC transporter ATP-binding protein, partial [Candidatus Polarisedimenticolia bacterium]|nr:ABC transporter ATP-binding protein [Candidatus Polarisedimenticolia bacterium]